MNIYFLGGGNMAAAIIAGLTRRGGYNITVAGRNAEKQAHLAQTYGVNTVGRLSELNVDDILILAVKPQDMQAATADVHPNGALVISVAAGLPVAVLNKFLHGHRRIVRVMPNTPCQVGLGVSGMYAPPEIGAGDKHMAESVMSTTGEVQWLPDEAGIDRIVGISGSGPAYVFYLLNALQAAARQQGFNDDDARRLSLATFKGAVALAEQSGEDFAVLQQKVTSKGGTTFAALQVFQAANMADTLIAGAAAAVARSQEMGKELGA